MPSPFVSVPASPPPDSPHLVQNDGWFPDVDLNLIRATYRLDTTVSIERLREATVAALLTLADELEAWKAEQVAAGHASLAAVPGPSVAGEKRQAHLYRRAVQTAVAAELVERLPDLGSSDAGDKRAAELSQPIDVLRRNASWAVADFLGRPRLVTELI